MADLQPKRGKGHKGLRSAKNKASGKYSHQAIQTTINRKRKRLKHVKRHPNDLQTRKLLNE